MTMRTQEQIDNKEFGNKVLHELGIIRQLMIAILFLMVVDFIMS